MGLKETKEINFLLVNKFSIVFIYYHYALIDKLLYRITKNEI